MSRLTALTTNPLYPVNSLRDGDAHERKTAAARLLDLAAGSGFLYLTEHGVAPELVEEVYRQAATYFARPTDVKLGDYIGSGTVHRGYVPVSEKGLYADEVGPRLYEAFDVGIARAVSPDDELNPLLGDTIWPDQSGFAEAVTAYLIEMQRLTDVIADGMERALDLPANTFRRHMSNPVSQLRILHYLPNDRSRRTPVNMGAHTDYELFTIVHSNHPGLQILDQSGRWVDAPPADDTFYFNIGDMFEAWTGGILRSTPHRVRNLGAERYSLAFFAATDYHTVIEPVTGPRSAGQGRVADEAYYPPIRAGEHLLTQLLRDFPYLRKRREQGLLPMLDGDAPVTHDQNPFEIRIHGNGENGADGSSATKEDRRAQ